MRVLSITPAYFPSIGGIEEVVRQLSAQLVSRGHTVDVAHVSTAHGSLVREQLDGLTVYRVPLIGHRLLGLSTELGRLCSGYDVLHAHDPQVAAITASLRLFSAGKPAVLSTHGGFRHTQRLAWLKKLYEQIGLRRNLAHYQQVLASSPSDATYFRRYSGKVELCGNGVGVARYSAVALSKARALNRWIYWGRLSANKRVDQAIDMVAMAHRMGHPVDLLICGRDPDGLLAGLQAKVRGLGLDDYIRFVPFLSDADLVQELHARSVYITASEHEGFGLSVVEALAAGLLVICRDMEPLNGFVRDGETGYLMDFRQGSEDASALGGLLSLTPDEHLARQLAARQEAAPYDWASVADQFESHLMHAARAPA